MGRALKIRTYCVAFVLGGWGAWTYARVFLRVVPAIERRADRPRGGRAARRPSWVQARQAATAEGGQGPASA